MATDPKSWGILGNPSREKIAEYQNMPVGGFRSMVKNLSRGKKNKVLEQHEIFVTKTNSNLTRGVIKVDAFTGRDAINIAMSRKEQIVWDETPYETDREQYSYSTYDPLKFGKYKSR